MKGANRQSCSAGFSQLWSSNIRTAPGRRVKFMFPVSWTGSLMTLYKGSLKSLFPVQALFLWAIYWRAELGGTFWCFKITGVGIWTRLLAGCTTGAMAVAFAQPTDVVKVRFQAQVRLPESGVAKRYNGTLDAYKTIARVEGIKGLWKGK